MVRSITLGAVPYDVTEQDGQVIFECRSGFYGLHTRFAFEWKGCGWYFTAFDTSFERVFAPHLVGAVKWIDENYDIAWDNGSGVAVLKPEPPYRKPDGAPA